MAQVITKTFIDDIDGSEAERTFTFAVDGVGYEIDLSASNINEFKGAVDEFVEKARKVGKATSISKRTATPGTQRANREQTQAVRDWLRANGHQVSDRGRISAEKQRLFDNAHAG